jgi:hypothetical protein
MLLAGIQEIKQLESGQINEGRTKTKTFETKKKK